jgi:hypothetical protein
VAFFKDGCRPFADGATQDGTAVMAPCGATRPSAKTSGAIDAELDAGPAFLAKKRGVPRYQTRLPRSFRRRS